MLESNESVGFGDREPRDWKYFRTDDFLHYSKTHDTRRADEDYDSTKMR